MELTPQFVLEKLLEFAKSIEKIFVLTAGQDERLDHLEAKLDAHIAEHIAADKATIADAVDERKERAKAVGSVGLEVVKGVIGAILGVASTLLIQHFFPSKP